MTKDEAARSRLKKLHLNMPRHNKSGILGVSWNANDKRWVAQIQVNYKQIFLGYRKTKEEAAVLRREAEIKYGYREESDE